MSDLPKLISVTQQEITALKEQYDLFRLLQKEVLEADVDYGFPHGKREGKPSLYKSGAEKLTRLFNLIPHFELLKAIEEENYVYYMFKATLTTASGQVVGEGFGSCNSKEKKHWNDAPLANANTILKMAKKRAHVDAVLTGLGASNVFTQDLEDYEPEQLRHNQPAQSPSQQSAQQPTQRPSQPAQPAQAAQQPEQSTQSAEQGEQKLSRKQLQYIHLLIDKIAKETEAAREEVEKELKDKFGIEHFSDLSKEKSSELIGYLNEVLAEIYENKSEPQQKLSKEQMKEYEKRLFG